jgi:hypothetical protein
MPRKLPISTLDAEAEDFRSVSHFAKTVFLSHNLGPFFNCSPFNLDGIAATFTD